MDWPHNKIKINEVIKTIRTEIDICKELQEVTTKCFKLITFIFNAMVLIKYFPSL